MPCVSQVCPRDVLHCSSAPAVGNDFHGVIRPVWVSDNKPETEPPGDPDLVVTLELAGDLVRSRVRRRCGRRRSGDGRDVRNVGPYGCSLSGHVHLPIVPLASDTKRGPKDYLGDGLDDRMRSGVWFTDQPNPPMEATEMTTTTSSTNEFRYANNPETAIPMSDVQSALATLAVEERDIYDLRLDTDGVGFVQVPAHKMIARVDNGHVHNFVTNGYTIHQFEDALGTPAQSLLSVADGDAWVQSFGHTSNGAMAWLNIALRTPVTLPGGDEVYTSAFLASSHGGTWASSLRVANWRQFCTNQLPAFHRTSPVVSVRHTSNSAARLEELRRVVSGLYDEQIVLERVGNRLVGTQVTSVQFEEIANILDPKPTVKDGETSSKVTRWENRRDDLHNYLLDPAVAPWSDNAWGVYQCFNGYRQHVAQTRLDRNGRTANRLLSGRLATEDNRTLAVIGSVVGEPFANFGLN